MKKKKGFTLVELLAVIVILAIIMIIAIPAVLNTMQTARKKSFMERERSFIRMHVDCQTVRK
jgi:type IV pilus assembly protein PilA